MHRWQEPSEKNERSSPRNEIDDWLQAIQWTCCVARQLRRNLNQQLADVAVNDMEFLLLWNCYRSRDRHPGQGELAATLSWSKAQISATVESLRQRDLLECYRPTEDRRRQHWKLTNGGQQLIEELLSQLVLPPDALQIPGHFPDTSAVLPPFLRLTRASCWNTAGAQSLESSSAISTEAD